MKTSHHQHLCDTPLKSDNGYGKVHVKMNVDKVLLVLNNMLQMT